MEYGCGWLPALFIFHESHQLTAHLPHTSVNSRCFSHLALIRIIPHTYTLNLYAQVAVRTHNLQSVSIGCCRRNKLSNCITFHCITFHSTIHRSTSPVAVTLPVRSTSPWRYQMVLPSLWSRREHASSSPAVTHWRATDRSSSLPGGTPLSHADCSNSSLF